jgi:hypothetical protein
MTDDAQLSLHQTDSSFSADTAQRDERILLSINQVEYSTAADGPIVHIFGRTETGDLKEIQVTGFFPYLYILASQVARNHPDQVIKVDSTSFKSIHGEELRRLYTRRPTDLGISEEITHILKQTFPLRPVIS